MCFCKANSAAVFCNILSASFRVIRCHLECDRFDLKLIKILLNAVFKLIVYIGYDRKVSGVRYNYFISHLIAAIETVLVCCATLKFCIVNSSLCKGVRRCVLNRDLYRSICRIFLIFQWLILLAIRILRIYRIFLILVYRVLVSLGIVILTDNVGCMRGVQVSKSVILCCIGKVLQCFIRDSRAVSYYCVSANFDTDSYLVLSNLVTIIISNRICVVINRSHVRVLCSVRVIELNVLYERY